MLLVGTGVALSGSDGGLAESQVQAPTETPADRTSTALPGKPGPAETPPEGTVTPDATELGEGTRQTGAETVAENSYEDAPPGVHGPNNINIHQVAGAFWLKLDNRSYRLSLTYRELEDGRTRGTYTETLRVETNERYHTTVTSVGTLQAKPPKIAGRDIYANGSTRLERYENSTIRGRATSEYDPFMVNATQYLGWFLSVRDSSIAARSERGATTTYHILTSGDPDPRFENVSGSVFMTDDGLLRFGRWEYTPRDDPDVRAVFEMRVTDVGSTEVSPPDWVRERTATVRTPTR